MTVRTIKLVDYGIVTRKEIPLYYGEIVNIADRIFTELGVKDILDDSDGGMAGALVSPLEVAVCRMATHEGKFFELMSDRATWKGQPLHELAFNFLRNLLNKCREYPSAIIVSRV